MTRPAAVSVVTPTLRRPGEVAELLENLAGQTLLPAQVVVVDGAEAGEAATEEVVASAVATGLPFEVRYVRSPRGTARQRNTGIDLADGDLVALVDDDVRLEPDFLAVAAAVFADDAAREVGGVVGYRTNEFLGEGAELPPRWRWYRRLRLLRTFIPGAYDWEVGYPVNANLQPPFSGTRSVEFMTTACAVWRREVFDSGLRFDSFFRDYGVLEDAHFSLRAGRTWKLLQCGDARCREGSAPGGRVSNRIIGRKAVVNYWFVFNSVAGPLSLGQRLRFWRFQAFELIRLSAYAVRHPASDSVDGLLGRADGIAAVVSGEVRRALRQPVR